MAVLHENGLQANQWLKNAVAIHFFLASLSLHVSSSCDARALYTLYIIMYVVPCNLMVVSSSCIVGFPISI